MIGSRSRWCRTCLVRAFLVRWSLLSARLRPRASRPPRSGAWERPFAEALEVLQDVIAPLRRIGHLDGQAVGHFLVPLRIYAVRE
jgi:hypothetical protein